MSAEASSGKGNPARTTVRRFADRGRYDRETVYAILDEALYGHVGFVDGGHPFVIPTIHVRIGDELFFHGSMASRLMAVIGSGAAVCVTVTLLDGLVLARSAFDHSMNYRSVVVLGSGRMVTDRGEKLAILKALSEHVVPGRWVEARPPSKPELDATAVACVPIREASAKIRTGGPKDRPQDQDWPVWAGVVPLSLQAGAPISDPTTGDDRRVPDYAQNYRRPDLGRGQDSV